VIDTDVKHLTLVVHLNLTKTVNLSLESDWLIGMLFQLYFDEKNNNKKNIYLIIYVFGHRLFEIICSKAKKDKTKDRNIVPGYR